MRGSLFGTVDAIAAAAAPTTPAAALATRLVAPLGRGCTFDQGTDRRGRRLVGVRSTLARLAPLTLGSLSLAALAFRPLPLARRFVASRFLLAWLVGA